MKYIQLNSDNSFKRHITGGNVEWDDNNFCTVESLIFDGKDKLFNVVPITDVIQPNYDVNSQTLSEGMPALVDGAWVQVWDVAELTGGELTQAQERKNKDNLVAKKQIIEQSLAKFAAEKDFDGIGEASALLNSTNAEWKKDAATFVRLWDETWQAFCDDKSLPELSWL